ncbi:hypothetical protein H0H93_005609 [Arthromyces matolae]|nr:hypothetical protein H0H93_005609 [Arthromyces matolae]
MIKHPDHTGATSTRDYQFYDRHLEKSLILKSVVYQPNLVDELENIADDAKESYLETHQFLPPIEDRVDHPFPGSARREKDLANSEFNHIVNEACIQRTYSQTTALHCSVVAATLEFKLPCWSSGPLHWDLNSSTKQTQAQADGYLRLSLPPTPTDNNQIDNSASLIPLPDDYLPPRTYFAKGVGIWEFKSLTAGDSETLETILASTKPGVFSWHSCDHGQFCHLKCGEGRFKKTLQKGDSGALYIGVETGPDANPPVCSSPSTDETWNCKGSIGSMDKASRILQQIWSEMVMTDATFACLNAGRFELMFRRSRGENVLFVSNIIATDEPKYYKRQTGLYIAMLRDAKQRAVQIKEKASSQTCPIASEAEDSSSKIEDPNEDDNPDLLDADEIQRRIRQKVYSRDWAIMQPRNGKGACFTFCKASPYDRVNPDLYRLGDAAPAYPGSEAAFTVTAEPEAVVSRGNIIIDDAQVFQKVYSKHAHYHKDVRERLQKEARIYLQLCDSGAKDVVPPTFGFFRHANVENDWRKPKGEYLMLLLEDTGISLDKLSPRPNVVAECLEGLSRIHAAGYCHGNISLEHIVYCEDRTPPITFISFGRAVEGPDDEMKDREREDLKKVLTGYSAKRRAMTEDWRITSSSRQAQSAA